MTQFQILGNQRIFGMNGGRQSNTQLDGGEYQQMYDRLTLNGVCSRSCDLVKFYN